MARQEVKRIKAVQPRSGNVAQNTSNLAHVEVKESKFVDIGFVGAGGSGVGKENKVPDFGKAFVGAMKLGVAAYESATAEERGDEVHQAELEGRAAAYSFESELANDNNLTDPQRLERRIQAGVEAGYVQGYEFETGQDAYQKAFREVNGTSQASQDVGSYNENIQMLGAVLVENWKQGNFDLPALQKKLSNLPLSRKNQEAVLSNAMVDEAKDIHNDYAEQAIFYANSLADVEAFVDNDGNPGGTARLAAQNPDWSEKKVREEHIKGILKAAGASHPLKDLETLITEGDALRLNNGVPFSGTAQGKVVGKVYDGILVDLRVDEMVAAGSLYDPWLSAQSKGVKDTWFARTLAFYQRNQQASLATGEDFTSYFDAILRSMTTDDQTKAARLIASTLVSNVENSFARYELDGSSENLEKAKQTVQGMASLWTKIMINPAMFKELDGTTPHLVAILSGMGIDTARVPLLIKQLQGSDIKTTLGDQYGEKFREMQIKMTRRGGITFAHTDDQADAVIDMAMWIAYTVKGSSVDDVVSIMFPTSKGNKRHLEISAYPSHSVGLGNVENRSANGGGIAVAVSHLLKTNTKLYNTARPMLGKGADWADSGVTTNITELNRGNYAVSMSKGDERMDFYVTQGQLMKAYDEGIKLELKKEKVVEAKSPVEKLVAGRRNRGKGGNPITLGKAVRGVADMLTGYVDKYMPAVHGYGGGEGN